MNNITFKITLSPLDGYFFGGEVTFDDGNLKNYYAKSNILPQETSLLGMLRFEILKMKGLLSTDNKNEVVEAVGENSFNFIHCNHAFSFGAIKQISPVFIGFQDELLYKAPFNYNLPISFDYKSQVFFGFDRENAVLPCNKDFFSKNYSNDKWISLFTGELTNHSFSKIFFQKDKIGITKNSVDKNDCFFKTRYCYLHEGYQFVFFAEIDIDIVKLNKTSFVTLGAERSVFKMLIEECKNDISSLLNKVETKENEIFFISDAFVPEKVLDLCKFSWTDTVAFRNLTRSWSKDKNYASLNKLKEKSVKYNLIRRGSVLFFDSQNQKDIEQMIDIDYLKRCGYNIYKKQ